METPSACLLEIRDILDGGTIFTVGTDTLLDILHPLVHHALFPERTSIHHIRRSQGDHSNIQNLSTNSLNIGLNLAREDVRCWWCNRSKQTRGTCSSTVSRGGHSMGHVS